jgi:hypothetical protein
METPLQYKVTQLIPDERPWLEQVQQLLSEQAREGGNSSRLSNIKARRRRELIRLSKACRTLPAPYAFLNNLPNGKSGHLIPGGARAGGAAGGPGSYGSAGEGEPWNYRHKTLPTSS